MAPYFSIIISAYNRGEMLRSALETIRFQTEKDFECLIVDDGSTDCVPQVIADFTKKDPRFKSQGSQKNQGMNAARNLALAVAQGRFVTFLDSDDFWLPERLEKFRRRLEKTPEAGFVFSNCYVLRFGRIVGTLFDPNKDIPEGVVPGHYGIGDKYLPYVTTNLAVSGESFKKWGFFKTGFKATDTELFARFLAQGLPVAALREPLAVRRIHEDQITAGHVGNFEQSLAAFPSSQVAGPEARRLREETAADVAMHLIKAARPLEAREFLKRTMGADAGRFAAWRLSYVPAPVLRALRDGKQALSRLRHHPLLLAPDARRALDVITPLLAAEQILKPYRALCSR